MDHPRASKRRKLGATADPTASKPSALDTRQEAAAATRKALAPRSLQPTLGSAGHLENTRNSQEIWQKAKASSRAGRQKSKTKSQDVHTDVDGALVGGYSDISKKIGATPTESAQLDPPRALKRSTPNGAPRATPAKRMSSLGFFQQFQKPNNGETPPTSMEGGRSSGRAKCSAVKVNGALDENVASPTMGPKPSKITFEDEIRHIEQTARDDAVEATSVGRRQASNPLKPSYTQQAKQPVENHSVLKRRKSNLADHTEPHDATQATDGSPMEVDDSGDDNHFPDANESIVTTPSRSRSQISLAKPMMKECVFTSEQLTLFKTILLEKLTGRRPVPLANLDEEYAKVSNVIAQTIISGESNSMLLIGARGSCKTTLIDNIVRENMAKHAEDFLVVRLNGFIHTDDKIALREIWRQLGREMDMDGTETAARNYADTLTTLLALLSHPSELGRDQPDQVTKSVIFILDEFELFASHPRQTLLYNLFDIAQSRKAPIAVLGLTTRVDVAESLEKRVKSRFSHRYVHLSLAKSLQAFQEACAAAMAIQEYELSRDDRAKLDNESLGTSDALVNWNSVAKGLLSTEVCATLLRRLYFTTKSVPDFMLSLLAPIATLETASSMTSIQIREHFSTVWPLSSMCPPDSKLSILLSLSTLQLALLICAARLVAIHDSDIVSFALAYEEYKNLASKAKLQASASGALAQGAGSRVSSKEVARDSWAWLVESGLVMDDGRVGGRVDVGLEEIGGCGVDLGQWGRWCKEI